MDNFDAKQRCAFLPGASQRSGSERPAVLSVFNRMASLCISGTDDVAGAPNTLLNQKPYGYDGVSLINPYPTGTNRTDIWGGGETHRDGLADVLHLTFLSLTPRIVQRALKAGAALRRMAFVINAETVRFVTLHRVLLLNYRTRDAHLTKLSRRQSFDIVTNLDNG